jgi:hypothetical protein
MKLEKFWHRAHTPMHVSRYCVAMLALLCYPTNYPGATAPTCDLLSSVFSEFIMAYGPVIQVIDNAIFTTQGSSSIGLSLPQINNIFLRRDGANNTTGDLNMSGRRVINIPTPTEGQYAANKS